MSDFTPTPEVVEAVAEAMERVEGNPARLNPRTWEMLSKVAIAAFVEAEGMYVEIAVKARIPLGGAYTEGPAQRLVGQYRPLEEA